jgi:uncharacterized damage-inducible protein DinB
MSETGRIIDLMERTYDGEAWHGPSLRTILKDVTAAQAAKKPDGGCHSIWELVAHIAQWEGVTALRLKGEAVEFAADSEGDWPPVTDFSEQNWQQTLSLLDKNHRKLREALVEAGDAKLAEKAPNREFTHYVALHGIIHHQVYHAGQIAVLKRMVKALTP